MTEDNISGNKWEMLQIALIIIGITFFGYIIYLLISSTIKDYNEYEIYKSFCEDKTDFCYCSTFQCIFKTQWSSISGLNNESKELCNIARELNDKEVIFEIGCEND